MAKADATKNAETTTAEGPETTEETASGKATKGAVPPKVKTYPLIVRDSAGEMVLSFNTPEERHNAQIECIKRMPGLEPILCSRGKYFPIYGQIAGVIIPPDKD
jgi:hypothetical protein